jgi:hypothetical protein
VTATSDPRGRRLRRLSVTLLVPAAAVASLDLAFLFGSGWLLLPAATALAVVAASLAGLSLAAVLVARSLDAVLHRRTEAARLAAAAARSPLVRVAPLPAPVRPVPAPAPVQVAEPQVPAGPGPLRPELVARPAVRRVATQRTAEPVGYSP